MIDRIKKLVKSKNVGISAALFLSAALVLVVFPRSELFSQVLALIVDLGPVWGSLLYIVLYIFFMVCLLPVALLCIVGGFMNGILVGTLLSWIGASVGAVCCFFLGRKVIARSTIESFASAYPILAATLSAISNHDGWKMVLLLRLSPLTPFAVLSYLLSTTKIQFKTYITWSSLGVIPGLFLYAYLGTAAKSFSEIFSGKSDDTTKTAVLSASLVITIAVVVVLSVVASRAIKKEMKKPKETGGILLDPSVELNQLAESKLEENSGDDKSENDRQYNNDKPLLIDSEV
jgi:uncharacterized membrane protein YdjX (TVP38/TMEM64 family)